jgi:hypothetical protein
MSKSLIVILILCILSAVVYAVDDKTGLEQRGDCPDMYEAAYKISQEQDCKLEWLSSDTTSTKMFCKNAEGWFAIDIVCSGVVLKMGYMSKADLITEGYILADKSSYNVLIGIIAFLAAAFILIKGISSIIRKRKQWDSGVNEGETAEEYLARTKEEERRLEEDLPEDEDEESTPKKKGAIRVIPKKRQRVHSDYVKPDAISDQADKKDIDNGGVEGW